MTQKQLLNKFNRLKNLEAGGCPQSAWALSNRQILLSQINPNGRQAETRPGETFYYWQYFHQVLRARLLNPAAGFVSAVLLFLVYNAVATLAGASLPGDAFYPIKTAQEKAQLALTFQEDKKVQLQMNFVTRRVDELQQLVAKNDDSQAKKEKVALAAQQIVQEVKSVEQKLSKISAASVNPDTLAAAKEVDAKVAQAKQDISDAKEKLSTDIKVEVEKDIQAAIVSTDNAGSSALSVLIKDYQSGNSQISEAEVTARLNEKIEIATDSLAKINEQIKVASSTLTLPAGADYNLDLIQTKLTAAQQDIYEAKELLKQKSFDLSLQKIESGKAIISAINSDESFVNIISQGGVLGTSTYQLLLPLNVASTTVGETSETTRK